MKRPHPWNAWIPTPQPAPKPLDGNAPWGLILEGVPSRFLPCRFRTRSQAEEHRKMLMKQVLDVKITVIWRGNNG